MILSRGRKYLFIHIPKTGGTSLALALEARAMKDDIMLGDTPKALKRRGKVQGVEARGRLWKHSTLSDLEGLLQPGEVNDLFVFTMVRNPWDRMVSQYHWLRSQSFDHPSVALAQRVDFETFVADPGIRAAQRNNPAGRYVTDSSGAECPCCFIRLEHFKSDAAPLFEHLGFELALPHENRSTRPGCYRDAYSEQTRSIVAEDCAVDIARFGYLY